MTKQEILDSGLLELYVLGDLDQSDMKLVTDALSMYPELRDEISNIENALLLYGKIHAKAPPSGTYDQIINSIDSNEFATTETKAPNVNGTPRSLISKLLWPFLFLLAILAGWWYINKLKASYIDTEKELEQCIDNNSIKDSQLKIFQQLSDPEIDILFADATEKYPETQAYLHNNENTKQSFLQIKNLPPITSDQSYQLWSIKGDLAPMPLDVFDNLDMLVFEIQHVDATDVYAITIEPRGGQQTPTLENLVATFSVNG